MSVTAESAAASSEYGGRTYFFCSPHCLEKFQAEPGKHAEPQSRTPAPQHSTPVYTCPMHPEVIADQPGKCPKCGMALEPLRAAAGKSASQAQHADHSCCSHEHNQKTVQHEHSDHLATRTSGAKPSPTTGKYSCPMHPEVFSDKPGDCPKCGMALEPRTVAAELEEDSEIRVLSRKFWIALVLTIPVLAIAMGGWVGLNFEAIFPHSISKWIEFALTTPVVLWAGSLFFTRGWKSIVNRSLNMFTLIMVGVGAAYCYSAVAACIPGRLSRVLQAEWRSRPLLRSGRGDHRAGVAGPVARSQSPQPHRPGHQSACSVWRPKPPIASATARRRMCPWTKSKRVINSAFVPAKKSRWMASFSKAKATWTSP